jgi:ABC-type dipeptide/oligopeptide/nickel transport system ATPase component
MASINIPKHPEISHRSDFFRPGFLSLAIIGKSGCGKTHLLASILPGLSENIKTVVIATVVKAVPVHLSIVDYFRKHKVYSTIVHEPEEALALVKTCEDLKYVTPQRQGLLIFDDFNIGRATGDYWDFTIHAFTKLRNIGWNFIILAQQPQFIPTIVRNCTTARILFDCYSKQALLTFTRDVADRIASQDAYDTALDYIRAVPYTYMMVREHPFEISAGKLGKTRTLITESSVVIPTLNDLMKEMGVSSKAQLRDESQRAQLKAGNTSELLIAQKQ